MKTYQDLLALGENEESRKTFVIDAIYEHKCSSAFITAVEAHGYYKGLNPTIMKYEKIIYDLQGIAHNDEWTANHKIASNFFNFAVTQENQYLLGNGAVFGNDSTKEKLGKNFDEALQELGKYALVSGVSFGLWNLDHIEAFDLTEFVPLYDEENGALRAGVRFWQIDGDKPLRATLYEEDGYTDYIRRKNSKVETLHDKRPYKLKTRTSAVDGEVIYDGENYPDFPIIPLWANDKKQSELVGRKGTLDAFDLLNSNLVNNLDEANFIYWVISNCGGMDDVDDAKFIERLKTMHVAHVDGDNVNGANVQANTIDVPYQASETAINTIKSRLYEDFMCLNVAELSAGNKTATEIRAAYQPLDSKCDMYEYCIDTFIRKLFDLIGIDDTVSFRRSRVINQSEEIQTILSAAEYLDADTVTEQICQILGMGDKAEEIIRKKQDENTARYADMLAQQTVTANNNSGGTGEQGAE